MQIHIDVVIISKNILEKWDDFQPAYSDKYYDTAMRITAKKI